MKKPRRIGNEQAFFCPGPLPGLNELIDARIRVGRAKGGKKWNAYSRLKKEWELVIISAMNSAKLKPVGGRAHITYRWQEPNKRRDPSNISSGGRKLIEDALQLTTPPILKGDGWRHISGFTDLFEVNKHKPGVWVTIWEGGE